jgi:hypothetical protein
MNEQSQRTVATWILFVVPFLVLGGFLSTREQLTLRFVGVYWGPAVTIVLVGVVSLPWGPLGT